MDFAEFFRSPPNNQREGGELMMMLTLLIGVTSLSTMLAGYVAMARD